MSRSIDRIVDRICMERGWTTREQIVSCMLELRSAANGSAPAGLTDLLIGRGFVDEKKLVFLLTNLEPVLSNRGAYDRFRRLDERLGEGLVQAGDATQGQITNALLRQETQAAQNARAPRLALLLLERGDVSLAAVEKAFDAIRSNPPSGSGTQKKGSIPEEVRLAAGDPRNLMGKYVAVEEVGRGSMGVVLRAWDSELHRWVALKKLSGPVDDDALARFRREARTVASLRHPNIAGVYDIFTDGGRYVLAMEFIEGDDLGRRKLPPRKAARLLAQIARALEHVHSLGIVHRDIKPQNILVDGSGKPYLMDFGIAKHLEDSSQATTMGTIIGTPNYMPPEQAEGNSQLIGPWTDLYSLGAVLFELLTGRPPFDGRDDFVILAKVQNQPLVPPSQLVRDVPPELESIVLKCMEKERENRFPSAKDLAERLEAFASSPAEQPSTVSRFRKLFGGRARKESSS